MIDFLERDGHLILTSTALRFDFDIARRRFSIGRPDSPPIIRDATARARFATLVLDTSALHIHSHASILINDAHGQGTRLIIHFQPERDIQLALHATLYPSHSFLSLRLIATNRSAQPIAIRQLTPLRTPANAIRFGEAPVALSFFKNGFQSWSYSGLLRSDQRDIDTNLGSFARPFHFNVTTPIERKPGVFWGEMFGALVDPAARQAIIAGQISAADQFAQVFADTRPGQTALTLTCDLDGVPLAAGQSIASEEMFVQFIDLPADDPFAEYIDAVARHMNPRVPPASSAGWCSWYFYFRRVREDDVIANLKTADERRQVIPIDLIQIDDGYQTKVGDWLSINQKFPHGMKWLADQIRASGHTPGVWLSPFIAVRSSQLVQQHPDWLIRNTEDRPASTGRAWGEITHGLDVTHPGAQDYVRRVIDTAVREWGYPYLKLDFLFAAAHPGARRDPTLTRAQVLRRGLELIRETAGDDVFLLGCGCPLGPAIGLMDGMRIGPDIALGSPSWLPRYFGIAWPLKNEMSFPAESNAARNVLTRSATHRKWWRNDPDCLIVRPARHMTEAEARSWASVVGLSGGLILTSDDLPSLPRDRQRYLTSVLPPLGENALPLDLFERTTPELYVLHPNRKWESGVVAGVFNWDDRPRRKPIDLAQVGLDPSQPYHAFEFWSGAYQRIGNGQIDLGELPTHGCAVVAIRPVLDRPHLVATTFHLTMGGELQKFDVRSLKLEIEVRLKRHASGEIWIAGCKIHEARAGDRPISIRQAAPEVWALPIEVDGSAQIDLTLNPATN